MFSGLLDIQFCILCVFVDEFLSWRDIASHEDFCDAGCKAGVFDLLEKEGIQEHDTVDVCGFEFEYVY